MDSSSFEGFHTQIASLLTVLKIKHSQHSCSIYSSVFKNKTEQNRNDEKYSQTGITVEVHTNHDGVRATAIVLRSYAASSSSWRYYKTNSEALTVLCSLVKHLGSG